MLRIQQYTKAESLQEAYELLQKNRNNQIIAGMCWLKMQDRTIPIAIDLEKLGLDQIEEDDESFTIGANVTLRMLEQHVSLQTWTHHVIEDAITDIVGVQFRNLATIGGSVYSRFGFSDILTALMCLHCEVILYKQGAMDIEEFVNSTYQRDIITHIRIYKDQLPRAFVCMRKSATDISTLNLSITRNKDHYQIQVGARPQKVKRYHLAIEEDKVVANKLRSMVSCDTNMRASEAYRNALVEALCLKALQKMEDPA